MTDKILNKADVLRVLEQTETPDEYPVDLTDTPFGGVVMLKPLTARQSLSLTTKAIGDDGKPSVNQLPEVLLEAALAGLGLDMSYADKLDLHPKVVQRTGQAVLSHAGILTFGKKTQDGTKTS